MTNQPTTLTELAEVYLSDPSLFDKEGTPTPEISRLLNIVFKSAGHEDVVGRKITVEELTMVLQKAARYLASLSGFEASVV